MLKKAILSIILLALLPLGIHAQVAIGISDTQRAYVSYTYKDHYAVKIEHSIYAEKFKNQYVRGSVEYKSGIDNFNISVSPFFGSTYNNNYWDTGALVNVDYTYRRICVKGVLNPLYDSTYGYTTCFLVGATCRVHGPLSITADYTTIPKYRMAEKRIRGGLEFNFDKFAFRPMVSLPVEGNGKTKSLRVDFSFNYQF